MNKFTKYGPLHVVYENDYNKKTKCFWSSFSLLEELKATASYKEVKRHLTYALSGNCPPVNSPHGINNASAKTKAIAIILYHRKVKK